MKNRIVTDVIAQKNVSWIDFEEACCADLFFELWTVIKSDEFAVWCELEERISDVFPTKVGDHSRV